MKTRLQVGFIVLFCAVVGFCYPAQAQFSQQGQKLVGTGALGDATQGYSVALSADGNTAIVGGPGDKSLAGGLEGAAWVWTRTGGIWTQQGTKLVGSPTVGGNGGSQQATSVSLSADGDTAIIGGPATEDPGSTWIWTRTGGAWTQQGTKLAGSGAVGHAGQGRAVSLSADGNTAIVGGPGDYPNGAAWIWTRSGGIWTQQGTKLVGSGVVGYANQGQSVALSADGNTAIVGGPSDNSEAGAAWIWTRNGSIWTQQGTKLVGSGAVGSARQGWSVALSADGNTAIVGGHYDNSETGAVWIWTRNNGAWTQQGTKLVGSGVVGRANQGVSVALAADGDTAIVGGSGDGISGASDGAVWIWTRSNGAWTQQGTKLVGSGAVGAAYQGHSVALSANGKTAIVGGFGDNSSAGAAWVFAATPLVQPDWVLRHPSVAPPPRQAAATAYDRARGHVLLFGGTDRSGGGSYLNDTWIWNGANWTQKNPSDSPSPRSWHAMAYDEVRHEVVLFGGYDGVYPGPGYYNETWVWNGASWTQKHPANSPTPRAYHCMAYDAVRQRVVLFGGFDGTYRTDTWTWDGTTWTRESPTNHPSRAAGATLTYDVGRTETVLFGGYSQDLWYGDETWVWDGSDWMLRNPVNRPPQRAQQASAYDATNGHIILFGGYDETGSNFRRDTWIWDGTNWSQQNPVNTPSPRISAVMAYDITRSEVVLFGGDVSGGGANCCTNDTWSWTSDLPPVTPTGLTSVWIDGHVVLAWADSSSDETAFKVERRENSSAAYQQIAVLARNMNSYVDTTSHETTSYCYRVLAISDAGESNYSNESCIAGAGGTAGQSLKFKSATYTVPGTPAEVTMTIVRSGGTSGSISATLLVSGGSAEIGQDYIILANGRVSFEPGETSKTVPVIRVLASNPPNSLTVNLKLTRPTGDVTVGAPSGAILTIQGAEPGTGKVGVFDAACARSNGQSVCTGKYFDANGYLSGETANLEKLNQQRVGAATDGVTLLLLRVRSSMPVTFSLRLPGVGASSTYGTLRWRDGTHAGQSVTVAPESTPSSGSTVYALYQAPADFPTNPEGLQIAATTTSGALPSVPITLKLPPVVLVHGLWSGPWAFADPDHLSESLFAHLVDQGYYVVTAAYSDDPAGSFDPNEYSTPILALSDATRSALRKARAHNIAASQVDVVAHSMGGLVARARATGRLPNGFSLMRDLPPYWRAENRFRGEFHKLITIGTPHRGTPVATWLIEHKCDTFGFLENTFNLINKPLDDAIYQFQPYHPVLRTLGEAIVPTHTIAGRTPTQRRPSERVLDSLILASGHPLTRIDTILGGARDHDVIVPVSSQLGGRTVGGSYGIAAGSIHSDNTLDHSDRAIAETTNLDLFPMIESLLHGPLQGHFEVVEPPGTAGQWLERKDCATTSLGRRAVPLTDSATLTPVAGTIVRPNDDVAITFSVPDGGVGTEALIGVQQGMSLIGGSGGIFATTFTVPPDASGDLPIYATTLNADGNNYSASTSIRVLPGVPPDALTVLPNSVAMTVARATTQLKVLGVYAGGSSIDLTSAAAGTTYTTESGTDAVVTTSADGLIEAQHNGADTIIVRNGILVAAVSVDVSVTNQRPSLPKFSDVAIHPGESLDIPFAAADADGDALKLTGLGLPSFATLLVSLNGTGTLRLRPTATDGGSYQPAIAVTDDGDPPLGVSQTANIKVYDPFTDDPLTGRVIRALHVSELRQRIDALRVRHGLGGFPWRDPVLTSSVSRVRRQHIVDLRVALGEVYAAAGAAPPTYTDPTLTTSTRIKALHLAEIRSAVVAGE